MSTSRLLPMILLTACGTSSSVDTGTDTSPTTDSGTTTTTTSCVSDPFTVEVGAGETAYTPLQAGDPVLIVAGPQGGWHIDLGGRVTGTSNAVQVAPSVFWVAEGEQIAGADQEIVTTALVGYDEATCAGEFFAQRAFVDDYLPAMPFEQFICELAGEELEVTLEVTDLATGVVVTESMSVTGHPDPETNNCP